MIYISLSGIVVIFIFLAFIVSKKQKSRVDYLLMLFNVLLATFIGLNGLAYIELSAPIIIAQNTLPFLIFPVFVLMVLYAIYPDENVDKRWYLLFLPGLIFFIITLSDHLLHDFSSEDLIQQYNRPPILYHIFFKGFQIIQLIILTALLKCMQHYEASIKYNFSYLEPIEVKWLRNFGIVYLVEVALTLVLFLSSNFELLPINIDMAFGIINGSLVLALFYMNYQGIKHYTIAQYYHQKEIEEAEQFSEHAEVTIAHLKPDVVRATRLDPKESERIFGKIIKQVEENKMYLEPALKLNDVADAINETPHAVSEVINTTGGQSFFDFINGYRVAHLKKMLKDPDKKNLTILALGLESGFNSKASLNRIFKNTTGVTPLQFQKQMD